MFFVLVQTIFAIKYWVLSRRILCLIKLIEDKYLEIKGKVVFCFVMFLTLGVTSTNLSIPCNKDQD